MSTVSNSKFSCADCGRQYTWKEELAGKRAKCACGQVMTVPAAPAVQVQEDLYDIAPDKEPAPAIKKLPLAPRRPRQEPEPQSAYRAPATAVAAATPAPAKLGYQTGPTQKQKDRMSMDNLIDMKRDIYTPVVLLVVGLALYSGYYGIRYELGGSGVAALTMGLGMITAIKALLLMGFAMAAAGPMGVSFGGVGTAALKLAAMAVFCDGVTTWVDAWVGKISGMGGGGGIFGYGALSFPVALLIYWQLLIHLFSMDSQDSWSIVMLLTAFDTVVKTALMMVLLATVLNWGGASVPSFAGGGGGSMSSSSPEVVEQIKEMKESGELEEAREFIKGGRQAALGGTVEILYANGCKNVWFEVSRDFNGRMTPQSLVIELPRDKVKDKEKRDKCYQTIKAWYVTLNRKLDADALKDKGETYIWVDIHP